MAAAGMDAAKVMPPRAPRARTCSAAAAPADTPGLEARMEQHAYLYIPALARGPVRLSSPSSCPRVRAGRGGF